MPERQSLDVLQEAFDVMRHLPRGEHREAKQTLQNLRAALNVTMGPAWGRALPVAASGQIWHTDPVQAALRIRRASEVAHSLPLEDYDQTFALLETAEAFLDREIELERERERFKDERPALWLIDCRKVG